MNTSNRLTRLVGFAIVIVTILVAGIGLFVVRNDVDRMREAGRENILWSAVQVEIELMRFQRALADFNAGDSAVTPRVVNDRFDILWSRVSLFEQGTVGERLSAYDEVEQTVATLFQTMQRLEPQIVSLQVGDRNSGVALQREFNAFSSDLRRLSRSVLHGEEEISASLREDLSNSSEILTIVTAVAVLISFLLIYVFARETRQFRDLAALNETLLHASTKAGRAKSQFLAMMSHELRTPMNGVLGLLALVKQQGLSAHQNRLVDQAERSGQQMIGLLGDILDFSALQDDQLKLESKPFEPAQLAEAVRDMFEPVALRQGIEFHARASENCPDRVMGDFSRLRQALTHLATYLLETAGTHNISLEICYEEGALIASISFDYSQVGGEWEPELIMGNVARSADSFASEALGPAVSRGLIERMGGSTKLDNPTADRIAIVVSVPAKELVVDTLLMRIVCQSTALEAICKAALRGENVRFHTEDNAQLPHVVLIEAGGRQEPDLVGHYAKKYPQAMLVALGRPQNPDEFDDIVEVPIDIATIRQSSFMQLTSGRSKLAGKRNLRYAGEKNTT